jgi:hypothetical protein
MSDKVLSWLWLPASSKVEVGQTLTAARLVECASPRALDALQRSPGTIICRIDSSGTVLAVADATKTLHEFACWSAEQALLQAGHEPDPRSWAAIEIKRKWLKGEATDEELDAARDAAWDAEWEANSTSDVALAAASAAARDAAWTVARVTASDAARVITTAAARAAVSVTASDAVWGAAWAAGWDAARDVQNAKLEEMLNDLLKEGAKDA